MLQYLAIINILDCHRADYSSVRNVRNYCMQNIPVYCAKAVRTESMQCRVPINRYQSKSILKAIGCVALLRVFDLSAGWLSSSSSLIMSMDLLLALPGNSLRVQVLLFHKPELSSSVIARLYASHTQRWATTFLRFISLR